MSVQCLSVGRGNEPRFIVSARVITIHCLYCSCICFPVCIRGFEALALFASYVYMCCVKNVKQLEKEACCCQLSSELQPHGVLFGSAASQNIDRLGRSCSCIYSSSLAYSSGALVTNGRRQRNKQIISATLQGNSCLFLAIMYSVIKIDVLQPAKWGFFLSLPAY